MKVAAYQAPLAACYDRQSVPLIRAQIERCESLGVELLCCPEGAAGGLADYVDDPRAAAIHVGRDLERMLVPLASARVTTVIGFTELGSDGKLYNAAAVVSNGAIMGIYRKRRPAINRSVYAPGTDAPLFTVGDVTFGILICRDSTFAELARDYAMRGADLLVIPSNNGLPAGRADADFVEQTRSSDAALAKALRVGVIRADVTGRWRNLSAHDCSTIVDHTGVLLGKSDTGVGGLIVADIAIPRFVSP